MNKVAAVVVLYNSGVNVLYTINTYINQVEKLFVMDNSEQMDYSLVEELRCIKNVDYTWNESNIGIAAALNKGATKAIDEGFEYLLTMDEDTNASPTMVSTLLNCFSADKNIAIVSSLLRHPNGRNIENETNVICKQIVTAWTSGNLIDLNIFKISGGFKEDFFIDYVDHEFCLRLNKMGYKVYVSYKTVLIHQLGKIKEVNLFFRKVYPTNHSALRLYYRARNRFYVKKIYKDSFPEFFKQDSKDFWRTFLKVVLFEKDRFKKIRFFIKGYIDYRMNKFGKLIVK